MNRRGVALPVVVLALLVVEAMIGTAFAIALHERRVADTGLRYRQALAAAEEGAYSPVMNWRPAYDSLAPGDSAVFRGNAAVGPGRYLGAVSRLSSGLFLVRAEGYREGEGARARVGVLLASDSTGVRPVQARSWLRVY